MKRILALSLSAALLLALLGACTAADPETTVISPDPAGASASVPPTDASQEPSLALPSEEPSAEPSAEPSQEPSQAPASQAPATQAPATQAPATQAPASTHHPEESHHPDPTHHPEESHHPDPSPTLPGGGIILPGSGNNTQAPTAEPSQSAGGSLEPTGPSASDVNLTSFYQSIVGKYAFPSMEVLPTDFTASMFPGLTEIPAVQRVASIPMMSGTASALVLVQVTNSSDVSAVKSILQAHINTQISRNANYPAVVESYQKNTKIVSRGSYVMLVVHDQCDAIVSDFNALF